MDKEEFTSEKMKETIEKVSKDKMVREVVFTLHCFLDKVILLSKYFQWVGPVEDMGAEFEKIDKNGGGQILFSEFVDWALEKDLDIEDDVEPEAE